MRFEREPLADFFALGRDLGWDTKTQRWTVRQLMDVKGRVPALGELIDDIDLGAPVEWSGDRYGGPRLRQHVVASQSYKVGADHVLITLGCQNANFLAAMALASPGEAVLLELPTWMHMHAVCVGLGLEVRTIRRREELGWRFDQDELRERLTSGIRFFYLCQPNNPTGAALNHRELVEVLGIARAAGTYVIADEIYRGLEWAGDGAPSVADLYERGISTGSVSKTIGLDALRIGWLVTSDREILDACCRIKQYITTPHLSGLDETLATAALEPNRFARLITMSRDMGRRNREIVSEWVRDDPRFDWVVPEAGFMGFPRYSMSVTSWEFCRRLLESPYRTYAIPGSPYEFEGYIRVAFGPSISPETLLDGLKMVSRLAAELVEQPA